MESEEISHKRATRSGQPLLGNAKLTLSPLEVRRDKALGTSSAVFCFFTMRIKHSGITTCGGNGKTRVKGHQGKRWRRRLGRSA